MNQAARDDLGKLLLRLALGVLVLFHGVAKLTGGLAGIEGLMVAHGLPKVLAYGVVLGEVLAPLLVILGWHANAGALLIAANMLVAIGLVHMSQLGQLNEQGGWALELQAMFLVVAVVVALLGPGRHSVSRR